LLDRATGEALLARLDAALNEVAEVRRQVVELMPPAAASGAGAEDADDLADALIDTTSAGARTGFARRLRANPRGSHAGVRQELAQGYVMPLARRPRFPRRAPGPK
jgi:hypothetical protein